MTRPYDRWISTSVRDKDERSVSTDRGGGVRNDEMTWLQLCQEATAAFKLVRLRTGNSTAGIVHNSACKYESNRSVAIPSPPLLPMVL
jgi:hypothetical protein